MTPELLEQIAQLLGQSVEEVQALTLEDIDELLRAAFDESAEPDEGEIDMDRLRSLRDARVGVTAAITEEAEAEAERLAEIERLREEMAPPTAETESPGDGGEEDTEVPSEDEAPTETPPAEEAPAEETPQPQAIAASTRVHIPRRRPAAHAPVPTDDGQPGVIITAAADVRGFSAGARIPTLQQLGQAFVDKVEAGVRGKSPVARMTLTGFPEERVLTTGKNENPVVNRQRIAAAMSPQAIHAAGGLCAPVNVRYELENVSVDDRPVRDALVRFNADRGGLNVPTSPLITAPDTGVNVVTEEQDTSGTTKPCVTVTCPSYSEVDVSAIYRCIQIGNFSRRTFPELFAEWWALAGALHARTAEGALLDGIGAASTNVTDGQNLGAARDIVEAGIRARAQMISRHRMSVNTEMRWLLPFWVRDLMRADLVREPSVDSSRIALTDAQIDNAFRAAHLNVTWYLDTETGEGQIYGTQGVQALLGWNLNPVSYMFPEGTFIFLDGGTLDLGTEIRDTTMNENNNVRAFMETFENVVKVGVESLEITHSLCVSGAASLPIAVTCAENS